MPTPSRLLRATLAAALLGATLARGQAPAPGAVDAAIDRGVAFLRARGEADGGRHLDSVNERTGLRALVVYTLLKGGAAHDDPLVLDVLFGLSRDGELQTYDLACLLLVLAAHDPLEHRAWIEGLAQQLVDTQEPGGAWSYPGLVIDLSNTQYAALGLWAASKAGVDVAPEVWRRLAEATHGYQSEDGGFSYTSPPGGSTGSMTTAGVGVLALCEQQLVLAEALDEAYAGELARRRARALAWLAANFAVDTNPNMGAHHYYYLYGLERMAALAGLARVGARDWYAEGATWLLAHQDEEGSWAHGADLAQTCFGVLFLERATGGGRRGPLSGPRSAREEATAEAGADVRVVCAVDRGVARARLAGLSPAALRPYLWPGEEGDGPRVRRVEYLVGGHIAGVALGAPERPLGTERLPALLRVRAPGPLVARVHLAPPPGTEGLPGYLESPPLDVSLPVVTAADPLARGAALDVRRARARASSVLRRRDGFPAVEYDGELAFDGNPATPWLTRAGDEKRSLRITPRKAVRAVGVYVAPPALPGRPAATLARPTAVELVLNGKSRDATRHVLQETGRTYLPFPAPLKVRSVELVIVETSGDPGAVTGLGEVTLRAADER